MIPYREVVQVMREAIAGDTSVRLCRDNLEWDAVLVGYISFHFGSWVLTFLNDWGSIGFLNSAVSTDGEEGNFHEWDDECIKEAGELPEGIVYNPLGELDDEERGTLESLLKNARKMRWKTFGQLRKHFLDGAFDEDQETDVPDASGRLV